MAAVSRLSVTFNALLGAALGVAVASSGVSLLSSVPERNPCRGPNVAVVASGRSCALHCMWSSRLCRICCVAKASGYADEDTHTTESGDRAQPTREPKPTEEPRPTAEDPSTDRVTETDPDGSKLAFPNQLPEGTQEAMLETAAHILAIVSREDSVRIRIWVENPERNLDNLERLAGKLASFPRAPFGRAYWRLVLRASKDRPFTLLREALAVRAAYLEGGAATTTAPTADEDSAQESGERWAWRLLQSRASSESTGTSSSR